MGYSKDLFAYKVDKNLICIICQDIIQTAVYCNKCETMGCQNCFQRIKNQGQPCPQCHNQEYSLQKSHQRFDSIIQNLLVKCRYQCGQQIPLSAIQQHEEFQCQFSYSNCEKCDRKVRRFQLEQHNCIQDFKTGVQSLNQQIVSIKQEREQKVQEQAQVIQSLYKMIKQIEQEYMEKINQLESQIQYYQQELKQIKEFSLQEQLSKKQQELQQQSQQNEEINQEKNIIYICELDRNNFTLNVDLKDTIETVKLKLQDKEAIPQECQQLIYDGKQLENKKTLNYYNIQYGNSIYLAIGLRG